MVSWNIYKSTNIYFRLAIMVGGCGIPPLYGLVKDFQPRLYVCLPRHQHVFEWFFKGENTMKSLPVATHSHVHLQFLHSTVLCIKFSWIPWYSQIFHKESYKRENKRGVCRNCLTFEQSHTVNVSTNRFTTLNSTFLYIFLFSLMRLFMKYQSTMELRRILYLRSYVLRYTCFHNSCKYRQRVNSCINLNIIFLTYVYCN